MREYGVDMVHVPFKGVAPAMTALVAGEIDVSITNLATALPQVRQGKIRVLAVTQPKRFEGAPEIPAIDEALPGFGMPVAWYGFFGPPRLPRPVAERIAGAIEAVLRDPKVRAGVADGAMTLVYVGPERLPDLIRETAAAYAKIVKASGVRLD